METPMIRSLALAAVMAGAALPAAAATAEHQQTPAGVQATEDHWSEAFVSGDEAYLSTLLDPAYVSVNRSGKARAKADIIALSRKVAAMPRQAYPKIPPQIEIRGDTAVVRFEGKDETSVDIFYWKAGAWRALYSQHTALAAPATPAG
jgi:hypothetical protein